MRRLKALLFASVATFAAAAIPFEGTNAGSRLFICATPQTNVLAQGDFEALAWVEITGIGNFGESGINTNLVEYPTWDATVVVQGKGTSRAGQPPLETLRKPLDPGQIILRAAGDPFNSQNYAFKEQRNDAILPGGVGTIIYNRGIVTGPNRPRGANEDWDLETYTLAFNQKEVVVNPLSAGNAPTMTAVPTITGTATQGQTLTSTNGTFTGDAVITYETQWFSGGQVIPGATAATFQVTAAQVGKNITVRKFARNAVGSATGFSAPTSVVT